MAPAALLPKESLGLSPVQQKSPTSSRSGYAHPLHEIQGSLGLGNLAGSRRESLQDVPQMHWGHKDAMNEEESCWITCTTVLVIANNTSPQTIKTFNSGVGRWLRIVKALSIVKVLNSKRTGVLIPRILINAG